MIMRWIWTVRAQRDCWNGGIQRWFADTTRGKVCVLVTSGGRFNIRRRSLALAGPPISAYALIRDCALIQENTVTILWQLSHMPLVYLSTFNHPIFNIRRYHLPICRGLSFGIFCCSNPDHQGANQYLNLGVYQLIYMHTFTRQMVIIQGLQPDSNLDLWQRRDVWKS